MTATFEEMALAVAPAVVGVALLRVTRRDSGPIGHLAIMGMGFVTVAVGQVMYAVWILRDGTALGSSFVGPLSVLGAGYLVLGLGLARTAVVFRRRQRQGPGPAVVPVVAAPEGLWAR